MNDSSDTTIGDTDAYRLLCTREPTIPLFSRAEWLDVVAPEQWDAVLVWKGGRVVGSHPFVLRTTLGVSTIGQPALTPYLGPWIRPSTAKGANATSLEIDTLGKLVDGLPHADRFLQNWNWQRTNWLPLYWRGYSQTTRYTYRLQDIADHERLWGGFRENVRRDIRKARDRFDVTVSTPGSLDSFLTLNRAVFSRQGLPVPYSEDLVRRIHGSPSGRCRHFVAVGPDQRPHAGVFVVWDEASCYYLLGGGDPELRHSGATSLAMWEAIKFASTVSASFDFEGSMIAPVERFFRAFGGTLTPYSQLRRATSKRAKAGEALLNLRRKHVR